MGCYWFVSFLDYDLTANSVGSPKSKWLPAYVWLICSICTFLAHRKCLLFLQTLFIPSLQCWTEQTENRQEGRVLLDRRENYVGLSTPLSLHIIFLVDHGLDSFSTVPFCVTIFSIFGQGEFSVPPVRLLGILISVQLVFIVTHWEKYNTGTFSIYIGDCYCV